eukprot:CAMPEP_0119560644 /NCGR_PEP_ID=MMETSP1352-20130426/15513_1 /TAXON_ID=265584 /ORGANISM="Stauroneis constricta, Strain CCMP1120" /LENGTH=616 /DNA_ID=CAMNT_0007608679 /DNA_START=44 /DNA_END=1891 /DNA_ORIENTATION=+
MTSNGNTGNSLNTSQRSIMKGLNKIFKTSSQSDLDCSSQHSRRSTRSLARSLLGGRSRSRSSRRQRKRRPQERKSLIMRVETSTNTLLTSATDHSDRSFMDDDDDAVSFATSNTKSKSRAARRSGGTKKTRKTSSSTKRGTKKKEKSKSTNSKQQQPDEEVSTTSTKRSSRRRPGKQRGGKETLSLRRNSSAIPTQIDTSAIATLHSMYGARSVDMNDLRFDDDDDGDLSSVATTQTSKSRRRKSSTNKKKKSRNGSTKKKKGRSSRHKKSKDATTTKSLGDDEALEINSTDNFEFEYDMDDDDNDNDNRDGNDKYKDQGKADGGNGDNQHAKEVAATTATAKTADEKHKPMQRRVTESSFDDLLSYLSFADEAGDGDGKHGGSNDNANLNDIPLTIQAKKSSNRSMQEELSCDDSFGLNDDDDENNNNNQLIQENETLQLQNTQLELELYETQQQLRAAQSKLQQLSSSSSQHQISSRSSSNRHFFLQGELECAQQDLKESKALVQEQSEEIRLLKQHIANVELGSAIPQYQQELEDREDDFQTLRKEFQNQCQDLLEQLSKKDEELEEARYELQRYKRMVAKQKEDNDDNDSLSQSCHSISDRLNEFISHFSTS